MQKSKKYNNLEHQITEMAIHKQWIEQNLLKDHQHILELDRKAYPIIKQRQSAMLDLIAKERLLTHATQLLSGVVSQQNNMNLIKTRYDNIKKMSKKA